MVKNKGFTYYELLIAITIMTLMVGFTTIGVSTAYRNSVTRSAEKIESACKEARNSALAKGNQVGYANFYRKDGKLYCHVGDEINASSNPVNLNSQNWDVVAYNFDHVYVTFNTGAGIVSMPANSGTLFTIGFKQSTGEVTGLKYPYASETTKYKSDIEITVHKGNNSSSVNIGRFGVIEVD